MREHLVELAIKYAVRRVECSNSIIAENRKHAMMLRDPIATETALREHIATIYELEALDRELAEQSAALNSTLLREELDYLQGELVRAHAGMFMPPETTAALAKDRMR